MLAPRRGATLLDRLGCRVENIHEGEGTRGNAFGRQDHVIGRPDAAEREPGAATAFVNQGGVLDRFEDLLHGISNREYETGGELSKFTTGIHQRGGVWHELKIGHCLQKFFREFCGNPSGLEILFGRSNGLCNPCEHVQRRFQYLAFLSAAQIAAFKDG